MRRNVIFDSVMDGAACPNDGINRKYGDRGFKSEAYVAMAKSMTESNRENINSLKPPFGADVRN